MGAATQQPVRKLKGALGLRVREREEGEQSGKKRIQKGHFLKLREDMWTL